MPVMTPEGTAKDSSVGNGSGSKNRGTAFDADVMDISDEHNMASETTDPNTME